MLTIQPFQWPVLVYLVLSGLSCGLALTAVTLLWSRCERRNKLGLRAALWATLTVLGGAVALIADLERPERFHLILTEFNPGSWVAIGARILVFHTVMCFVVLMSTRTLVTPEGQPEPPGTPAPRWALLLLLLTSLGLGSYPALLLGQATMRPLWGNEMLAPLWLVSGIHGGMALLLLLVALKPIGKDGVAGFDAGQLDSLRKGDALLILVQATLMVAFLFSLGQGAGDLQLTTGPLLWIGVVIVGWLLPLFEMTRPGDSRPRLFVRSALVIAGAVAFRAVIFHGGQTPSALIGA